MKKIFFVLIFILISLGLWGIAQAKISTSAPAKNQIAINFGQVGQIELPPSKFDNVLDFLAEIINWVLGIVGALAVIAIVYSGMMYMTSTGDPAKAEAAKKNLAWAIVGLVLITTAIAIVNFVGSISP